MLPGTDVLPNTEDCKELLDFIYLFDITVSRKEGQVYVVPHRILEEFKSKNGYKLQDLIDSTSEFKTSLKSMQYLRYISDERYLNKKYPKLPHLPNNLKIWIYEPYQSSTTNTTTTNTTSTSNASNLNSVKPEYPRVESAKIEDSKIGSPSSTGSAGSNSSLYKRSRSGRSKDEFSITERLTEAIYARPPLIIANPRDVQAKVNRISYLFNRRFPDYHMIFTPFGSEIYGLSYNNKKPVLNINIELDEPDLERLINRDKNPYDYDTTEPQYIKAIESNDSNFISFDETTNFIKLKAGHDTIVEYGFNKTIITSSTDLIKRYIRLDPRVPPFLAAIKYFGRHRNIFQSQIKQGIKCYGYIIMGLAYLQSLKIPVLPNLHNITESDIFDTCPDEDCFTKHKYWDRAIHINDYVGASCRYHSCVVANYKGTTTNNKPVYNHQEKKMAWNSTNNMSVGDLFLDFLYYYGYTFDYTNNGVSLKMGGVAPRKAEFEKYPIVIEDPILSGVNIAERGADKNKLITVFRGGFSLLIVGQSFESILVMQDIGRYNDYRDAEGKRYLPYSRKKKNDNSMTRTILLMGLPKENENNCSCDLIRGYFSNYGDLLSIQDLDNETKLIYLDVANNVTIPSSCNLNNSRIFIVELYESVK